MQPRCCNLIENYEPPRSVLIDPETGKQLRTEEKTTELMIELIERLSNPGGIVADFFAGTATTALAALRTGRYFKGCDSDEKVHKFASLRLFEKFKYFKKHSNLIFQITICFNNNNKKICLLVQQQKKFMMLKKICNWKNLLLAIFQKNIWI